MSSADAVLIDDTSRAADAIQSPSIVSVVWPLMLVALATNLPNPAANIFVGPISTDYDIPASLIGSMRGLGGGAALLVAFLFAPLLDRLPRRWTVVLGLGLVLLASSLPLTGLLVGLALSFAFLGSAMAIVMPTIQAACGDLFEGPEAGRAAALVQSSQTLAGVAAGPVLTLPALVAGWHGAYLVVVLVAAAAIIFVAPRLSGRRPERVIRTGYRQAFALVAKAPGATLMLLSTTTRACGVQAWLAFLAASQTDRFDATVGMVAVMWFFGAGSVFVANYLTGCLLAHGAQHPGRWWGSPERVLLISSGLMIVTMPLVYVAPTFELAFVAAVAFCLTVGVSISSFISVLITRYAPLRGPVMGLNAAGQNVGIVGGTTLASIGLSLGGYLGLAILLAVLSAIANVVLVMALRQYRQLAAA